MKMKRPVNSWVNRPWVIDFVRFRLFALDRLQEHSCGPDSTLLHYRQDKLDGDIDRMVRDDLALLFCFGLDAVARCLSLLGVTQKKIPVELLNDLDGYRGNVFNYLADCRFGCRAEKRLEKPEKL